MPDVDVFLVTFFPGFIAAARTGRKLLSVSLFVMAPRDVQPSPALMWINERIHTDMDLLPLQNRIKAKLYFEPSVPA